MECATFFRGLNIGSGDQMKTECPPERPKVKCDAKCGGVDCAVDTDVEKCCIPEAENGNCPTETLKSEFGGQLTVAAALERVHAMDSDNAEPEDIPPPSTEGYQIHGRTCTPGKVMENKPPVTSKVIGKEQVEPHNMLIKKCMDACSYNPECRGIDIHASGKGLKVVSPSVPDASGVYVFKKASDEDPTKGWWELERRRASTSVGVGTGLTKSYRFVQDPPGASDAVWSFEELVWSDPNAEHDSVAPKFPESVYTVSHILAKNNQNRAAPENFQPPEAEYVAAPSYDQYGAATTSSLDFGQMSVKAYRGDAGTACTLMAGMDDAELGGLGGAPNAVREHECWVKDMSFWDGKTPETTAEYCVIREDMVDSVHKNVLTARSRLDVLAPNGIEDTTRRAVCEIRKALLETDPTKQTKFEIAELIDPQSSDQEPQKVKDEVKGWNSYWKDDDDLQKLMHRCKTTCVAGEPAYYLKCGVPADLEGATDPLIELRPDDDTLQGSGGSGSATAMGTTLANPAPAGTVGATVVTGVQAAGGGGGDPDKVGLLEIGRERNKLLIGEQSEPTAARLEPPFGRYKRVPANPTKLFRVRVMETAVDEPATTDVDDQSQTEVAAATGANKTWVLEQREWADPVAHAGDKIEWVGDAAEFKDSILAEAPVFANDVDHPPATSWSAGSFKNFRYVAGEGPLSAALCEGASASEQACASHVLTSGVHCCHWLKEPITVAIQEGTEPIQARCVTAINNARCDRPNGGGSERKIFEQVAENVRCGDGTTDVKVLEGAKTKEACAVMTGADAECGDGVQKYFSFHEGVGQESCVCGTVDNADCTGGVAVAVDSGAREEAGTSVYRLTKPPTTPSYDTFGVPVWGSKQLDANQVPSSCKTANTVFQLFPGERTMNAWIELGKVKEEDYLHVKERADQNALQEFKEVPTQATFFEMKGPLLPAAPEPSKG
eukprot:g20250.t1